MRTQIRPGRSLTLVLLTLSILVGFAASVLAAHPSVTLKDANDVAIPLESDIAYSAKNTCGGCHDYDNIEQHSYHAQLGANQFFGWNSHNPDSPNKFKRGVAAKGKSWVQSPGHVGKW